MYTLAHAILVEGSPNKRAHLTTLITQLGYQLSPPIDSTAAAVEHCRRDPPDILFLDVDTPGTIDAEVAIRLIREHHDVPVVQLTSLRDGEGALVRKDTDRVGLARGIAYALGAAPPNRDAEPPQDFILPDRILLRQDEKMVRINITDVNFFRARRNYCSAFTDDSEYLISIAIQLVEHRLGYRGFLRTHRSYLVNHNRIRAKRDNELELTGATVPIGRGYRRSVKRLIP